MALRYDFDMVAITPEGLPGQFGDLDLTGVSAEKVAMFRDPQTIGALGQADEAVRTFFTDSGFVLKTHDSGAPPGTFPMRDEGDRVALVDRLSQNLGTHNLKGANWGGFDFPAFMQSLSAAKPIEEQLLAPTQRDTGLNTERAAARIASRQKQGRRMMAFGGLLLGLILLLYVAGQLL
ncbi:hypothetical protein [Loktanella sp. Alg231-35]|uniref:hypothetical protein n=1 Tax=Loktanella sp. Alg231-35 TaxID=1922220 RepID=UPI000D54E6AE|nr:hypothetical protein [Loktanella sp. Alg231-35]